jgi:hypothetical protein
MSILCSAEPLSYKYQLHLKIFCFFTRIAIDPWPTPKAITFYNRPLLHTYFERRQENLLLTHGYQARRAPYSAGFASCRDVQILQLARTLAIYFFFM